MDFGISILVAPVAQALDSGSDGLSLMEIVTGIPHDVPAVVIYLLSAFSIGWVIRAGTRSGRKDPSSSP